jgi:hypothetical protein
LEILDMHVVEIQLEHTKRTFGECEILGLRLPGKETILNKEEYQGTRVIPHLACETKSVRELGK